MSLARVAPLSDRDRRALRVGVLGIFTLWTLLRGIPAIVAWTRLERASTRQLLGEVEAHRRVLTNGVGIEREADQLRATWEAVHVRLLAAPNTAALLGGAAGVVSGWAEQARLTLGELATDRVDTLSLPMVVGWVRLTGEGDLESVVDLLQRIEHGTSDARIGQLRIEALDARAGGSAGRLHVEVRVGMPGIIGETP
ncbi:MAG: hypothetical protein HY275_13360 [Gemmatimonadetes bacterium]|nr:hypothetical protein [Gemmatimonadota bacterium]